MGPGNAGTDQNLGLVQGIGPEAKEGLDDGGLLHQLGPAGVDHADGVRALNGQNAAVADEGAELEACHPRDDDAVADLYVVQVDEGVDDTDHVVSAAALVRLVRSECEVVDRTIGESEGLLDDGACLLGRSGRIADVPDGEIGSVRVVDQRGCL